MKILLIIGHNPKSKGAYNTQLSMSEFDFWRGYVGCQVNEWFDQSGHEFKIVTRPYLGRYKYQAEMRHVHGIGKEWGAEVSCEFHFNGATDKTITGHEVLHFKGSREGKRIARICDKAFDEHLPNRDRGVKRVGVTDSGGYGLYVGQYPSILFEPFFNSQLVHYLDDGKYRGMLNEAFNQFFKKLS